MDVGTLLEYIVDYLLTANIFVLLLVCLWLDNRAKVKKSIVTIVVAQVADMLRIISLSADPVFLTRFLQDEVLPG